MYNGREEETEGTTKKDLRETGSYFHLSTDCGNPEGLVRIPVPPVDE